MSNSTYYTTEQLAAETEKLLKAGRPIWEMATDPQCPPDVAAKLLQLKQLLNPTTKN